MSRKSRQPRPVGPRASTAAERRGRYDVPFGVVVLLATALSIPTMLRMTTETMSFDAGITRLLIALAVAWLLTNLVTSVIDGMRPDVPEIDLVGQPPVDQPHLAAPDSSER